MIFVVIDSALVPMDVALARAKDRQDMRFAARIAGPTAKAIRVVEPERREAVALQVILALHEEFVQVKGVHVG
jgi:hypothetical protein